MQVSTLEPASAPIVKRFQQVWTPTLMLLSRTATSTTSGTAICPRGCSSLAWCSGWGMPSSKEDRFEDAARCFDEVVVKYPLSDVAPEATYWAAVSRYKGSHEAEDLLGGWKKLQSRYPESPWRVRQSFIEQ